MKNLETRESCKLSKICSKSTWPVSRASCENSGNQRVGVSARVAGGRGVRRECRELLTPNRSCEFFEIRNQRGGTENQRCDLVFLRDHPPSKPASRESGNQRVEETSGNQRGVKNLETRESCKLSKICSKSTWPVSRASCENSGNQRVGVSARVAGGRGVRRECRELLTPNRSCEFFEIRNQRGGTENQRCDLVFLRDHPPSKPASRESGNQRVATEVVKFLKSASRN